MTVSAQTPYSSQAANGVTTAFPFAYKVRRNTDIVVTLVDASGVEATQTLGVHYTVSGVGSPAGGSVDFTSAPAAGYTVKTSRVTALARTTDYQSNGDLLASVLNGDVDAVWLALQELLAGTQAASNLLRVPLGEVISLLPPEATRAGKFLGFDPQGDPVALSGTGNDSALRTDLAAATGSTLVGFRQTGTGAAVRLLSNKVGEILSVKDFGAVGDGVADDTAAFTNAIAVMALRKGGTLWIPRGTYKVTSALDFSALSQFRLEGEGMCNGQASYSSQILGNFADHIVKYAPVGAGGSVHVANLTVSQTSTNAAASALALSGFTGGVVENCNITSTGGWGITNLGGSTFSLTLRSCVVHGNAILAPTSIGIQAGGHTEIIGCDLVGWAEGIRACGPTVNITGCRFEVNKTALKIGLDATGGVSSLGRSSVAGNSFEANDVAIDIVSMDSSSLSGFGIQGSVNSPSAQSQIGVRLRQMTNSTIANGSFSGTYSNAAFIIDDGSGCIENIQAGNSFGGNSRVWDVKAGLGSLGNSLVFQNTNYTVRPDDTVSRGNSQRHGQVQYLAQIDYLNANVEGKNLRGKNIALGAGVTTKAVAFTGAGHSAGASLINTAAAGVTGGATLAPATYFYLATAVTAHGEAGGTGEKTVTVGGANNSATLTFLGMTADGFKRRVYRGTQSGVYDGYFELPLNSNAAFVDIGLAFDGRKSQPTGDNTNMTEPDANYAVIVTPSWLTTFRVTGKATTGFTVDFGTATPDANQTFDWFIVR